MWINRRIRLWCARQDFFFLISCQNYNIPLDLDVREIQQGLDLIEPAAELVL